MRNPAWSILPLAAVLLMLSGCGPNSARVHGTVTLDNAPLTTGTVTFHPAAGQGAIAYGQIDSQGRYELSTGAAKGLVPGAYVVTVVATEEVAPTSPTAETTYRSVTPAKYADASQSGLNVEVKSGTNDIPLRLTSK